MKKPILAHRRPEPEESADLRTPTDLDEEATAEIATELNATLADVFTLYVKTKNFHWHMSGPHFRDYHLLLDQQAEQIFAMSDPLAERVRKLGRATVKSIGEIARLRRVGDSEETFVAPAAMLAELRQNNLELAAALRQAHGICEDHGDIASASLIETWTDETERRAWFLFEATRGE